jgi:biopolymer transport protein ExbB/TolQ
MTDTKILAALLATAAGISGVAIVSAFAYLRHVREQVRRHRDVRRMVTEASKPFLPFESGTHAKQR